MSLFAKTIQVSFIATTLAVLAVSSAGALTSKTTIQPSTTTQQQHLATIISKGNQEIDRRLSKLSDLSTKIAAATKLSTGDKTTLNNEVSSTQSGLTSLKSQLDNETTIVAAVTDAKSIYADYRVYALVVPKVNLVKTADDEQVTADKLAALSAKLTSRLNTYTGSDKAALQSDLSDLNAKMTDATSLASGIETSVINLQPSDYNSNHAVLSGDRNTLITAHSDNVAATADAKSIISALN